MVLRQRTLGKGDEEDRSSPRIETATGKDASANMISTLFRPVDPSSLAVFRVLFGLVLLMDLMVERMYSSLPRIWGDPDQCHFPLFSWWPMLSLPWLYLMYFVMFLSSIGIFLGLLFRISSICFAIAYWYVFLSETTVWNNHTYLYGLISLMMVFLNANHAWSIDGLIWPSMRNKMVPNWNYAILRFQIFVVYFYAGIKKLDPDWVQGYSMQRLGQSFVFNPFRLLLTTEQIDFFIVHLGGLFIDLTTGFLLLNDKTRIIGLLQGCSFHLMNSQMFSIGMFPYAMLATMVLFLSFDWPKRLSNCLPFFAGWVLPLAKDPKANYTCSIAQKGRVTTKHAVIALLLSNYVFVQLTLPFSHSLTQGYNSWSEGLYGYSWDMMVKRWRQQHVVIRVVDGATNQSTYLKPGVWLSPSTRLSRIGGHPDVIKRYAECISKNVQLQLNMSQPAVYFDIWRSMNNRFQQRAIDPTVDIMTAPWHPLYNTPWYMPLLSDLAHWRKKFKEIEEQHANDVNTTDVVFVADFPGLFLENFIEDDVEATVTLLKGSVHLQVGNVNTTLKIDAPVSVPSNETHFIHVISDEPACYMYMSRYNEAIDHEGVEDEPSPPKKTKSLSKLAQLYGRSLAGSFAAVRLLLLGDVEPFNRHLNASGVQNIRFQ